MTPARLNSNAPLQANRDLKKLQLPLKLGRGQDSIMHASRETRVFTWERGNSAVEPWTRERKRSQVRLPADAAGQHFSSGSTFFC